MPDLYDRDLDFFNAVLVTTAIVDCSSVDYTARTSQQFIDVIVEYIWNVKYILCFFIDIDFYVYFA